MAWFIAGIVLPIIIWATAEVLTGVQPELFHDLPFWLKPFIFQLSHGGLMTVGAIEAVLIVWVISACAHPLTPQRRNLVFTHSTKKPWTWNQQPVAIIAGYLYEYAELASRIYKDGVQPVNEWSPVTDFPDGAAKQVCEKVGLRCGIWVKQSQYRLPTVAVVFRGTRPASLTDWKSWKPSYLDWRANLRFIFEWVFRCKTHYTVIRTDVFKTAVRSSLDKLLKQWRTDQPDKTIDSFRIVAVGHSLGAGLAEYFAYEFEFSESTNSESTTLENKQIVQLSVEEVFAFDSSPISGRLFPKTGLWEKNAKKMIIHQAFERGEALAYLRFLLKPLYRRFVEFPTVFTSRFNFTKSLAPMAGHSMPRLAEALNEFRNLPAPREVNNSDRVEQFRMIYDYIKFHIGLYVGTPLVIMILAVILRVEKNPPFVAGMIDMVLLYLLAGIHAAWFMGTHLNRKWESDFLDEFEESAFKPTRSFWHHWMYWSGLIVGLSGIGLSKIWMYE